MGLLGGQRSGMIYDELTGEVIENPDLIKGKV